MIPNGAAQGPNAMAQAQDIPLPRPEKKITLTSGDISLKRLNNTWQLWYAQRPLRDFGEREMDARDALRVYQDLHPTEWVTIGEGKPIVEYGLVHGHSPQTAPSYDNQTGGNSPQAGGNFPLVPTGNNQPIATGAGARQIIPIDLRSVRVEAVRGVWCLRDDCNILINFGVDKTNADQAVGAVRKYGFNRLGMVGSPTTPAMSYFFAMPETQPSSPKGPLTQLNLQSQIENLAKVGIPVAGLGYVGEMVHFDPLKIEVRKIGGDWVVAAGPEVLGRFGPSEGSARDAAHTMLESHFTEFCKVGSAGLTFFLVNGQAPTRLPFSVQGRLFDLNSLKVSKIGERWAVTESGHYLFDCANAEEGDILIRLLKSYQFDQICRIGPASKLGVSFFAKSRG